MTDRSPEELRGELCELRAEMGDTVGELAHRADVPARARAKKDETVERVQHQVAKVRALAAEKAPEVRSSVLENPVAVGGGALVVALLVFLVLRRRSRV